ncbi:MAG TPA: DUF3576 domain-containing protein [Stellaceae bacterium]
MSLRTIVFALSLASLVGGCAFFGGPAQTETDTDAMKRTQDPYHTNPDYSGVTGYNPKTQEGTESFSVMGLLFGSGDKKSDTGQGGPSGVGVNSYLWRATLDTVSFMPLASADPFGGVIITDWYSPSETPNERFKMNVLILGRELRADGVRATVFRQKRDASGQWADAPVEPQTGIDLENAILTRARQLRLNTASSK